ncbi:hypothetical protein SAMN05216436_102121 [bacterium A37T11]|nr:hypothetical protein SAMN05216436_102121 [bacterium A37T11]
MNVIYNENFGQEDHESFLDEPIRDLVLASETFKLRAALMGYKTIREILNTDKAIYQNQEDYTQNWFNELIFILHLKKRPDLVEKINSRFDERHLWN